VSRIVVAVVRAQGHADERQQALSRAAFGAGIFAIAGRPALLPAARLASVDAMTLSSASMNRANAPAEAGKRADRMACSCGALSNTATMPPMTAPLSLRRGALQMYVGRPP